MENCHFSSASPSLGRSGPSSWSAGSGASGSPRPIRVSSFMLFCCVEMIFPIDPNPYFLGSFEWSCVVHALEAPQAGLCLPVSHTGAILSRAAGVHLFFPSWYPGEQSRNLCLSRRQSSLPCILLIVVKFFLSTFSLQLILHMAWGAGWFNLPPHGQSVSLVTRWLEARPRAPVAPHSVCLFLGVCPAWSVPSVFPPQNQ